MSKNLNLLAPLRKSHVKANDRRRIALRSLSQVLRESTHPIFSLSAFPLSGYAPPISFSFVFSFSVCQLVSFCTLRLRRTGPKEEPGVNVGNALTNYFSNAIAVTPPSRRVIIRVRNRDDTYRYVLSERFLIEKERPPRMGVLRQNVDTMHERVVFAKPIS